MQVPVAYNPYGSWPSSIVITDREPITKKTWQELYDPAVSANVPDYLVAVVENTFYDAVELSGSDLLNQPGMQCI